MKKYNSSTGNYKIDIHIDSVYHCSTDWAKTCKEAKANFLKRNKNIKSESVKAFFYKN